MKVAQVQRIHSVRDLDVQPKVTHHNRCQIMLDNSLITLYGPRFGFICTGRVIDVQTSYDGGFFHLHLEVLVRRGATTYTYKQERWDVRFLVGE